MSNIFTGQNGNLNYNEAESRPRMTKTLKGYQEVLKVAKEKDQTIPVMRELCKTDLFFLLTQVLGRKDLIHPWIYERAVEVNNYPDGYLDLWSREYCKSSLITFGLTIKDILNDPEITCCIFSFNRPSAKTFLRYIKEEFEKNKLLYTLFPDILWEKPSSEAPVWSVDNGIVVKRKSNRKESTVEAYGLIEGQPTGRHFSLMVYDDAVTRDSVTTAETMRKVLEGWELTRPMTARGGRSRYIGTRYHANDLYGTLIKRKAATPRIYPATIDGTADGEPILFTKKELEEKRRDHGNFTFNAQYLQNPAAQGADGFNKSDVRYWDVDKNAIREMVVKILCDPASSKKQNADFTAIFVVGYGEDGNFYVIDMYRDRLSLNERTDLIFDLHRVYGPDTQIVYEKYGMSTDIEHIESEQKRRNYHFRIRNVAGNIRKEDRIRRLVPIFENERLFIPRKLVKTRTDGKRTDTVRDFLDEVELFPVSQYDDMLDCLSRIIDVKWERPSTMKRRRKGMMKANTSYNPFYAGESRYARKRQIRSYQI